MDVDADPHPDGMLLLQWRDNVLHVQLVLKSGRDAMRKANGGLYRAHLVTCAAMRRSRS